MNAAEYLTADLEQRRGSPLVKGARFVANLALMAVGGGSDDIAVVDLVIRRRDTEREIMRTPADMGDPLFLLQAVRRDLESMSILEFVAEWKLPDDTTA